VELWSEVLELAETNIGIDSNFFELGGHSLKATVMVSKIHRLFNIRVPLVEIFKAPTVRNLAEYIKNTDKESILEEDDNMVLLRKKSKKAGHLFFVHDGSGEVEGYVDFCQHLNVDFNYWGIRADRVKNYTPRNLTIEEIASKYIERIKRFQPKGSYFIVGWSLGGTIAFEMVRQLEQKGEEIGFFALIDSPEPQGCSKDDIPIFTLETEKSFIKKYLSGKEIEDKLENVTDINSIWPFIVDYLRSKHFDVEIIKKVVVEYEAHVVPDYIHLSIDQLIEYLNAGRTFHNARTYYTPAGKIHTIVHYFSARQSRGIIKESWNDYCNKPIRFYEISGDHYSIFKRPKVIEFSDFFGKIINGQV
jgi:thioesterase domain-containing protein/acyl carrier protein